MLFIMNCIAKIIANSYGNSRMRGGLRVNNICVSPPDVGAGIPMHP